jgi:methyl-accepting chemotaxis protein
MRIRFRHSLHGRLIVFGILPALVLALVVTGVGLVEKFSLLRARVEEGMTSFASSLAARAEDRMNDAVRTARILAESAGAGSWRRPEELARSFERVLADDPSIRGLWIDLEGERPDQRFSRRFVRDPAKGDRVVSTVDATLATGDAAERARARVLGRGVRESIVSDAVERDGEWIIEVVHPIVDGDRIEGFAASEYALSEIQAAVDAFSAQSGMQMFVLSSTGRIVATSVAAADGEESRAPRGVDIAKTPFAPVIVPLLASAGGVELSTGRDPLDGRETYFVTATTKSGGLRIVLMRPTADIMGPIAAAIVWNLAIVLGGLAAMTGLLVWLAWRVRRRIGQAIDASDAIAQGDLTRVLERPKVVDETDFLLDRLGEMSERLTALVARVKSASSTLDASIVEIGRSTAQQREAAIPLGQSAVEVAAAAKQISATGVELARTMEAVQGNASEAVTIARNGRAQLAAVDASMRELDSASTSVAAKLAAINERAVAITTVVTTITKVADQTNLLSVNAAIEAEKAGEQGRGFLVVAREIRRLADQTAAATHDIRRMVEEMQSAVSAGVMEMDRFADKLRRSVDDVDETSRRIGGIIERVAENTDQFRDVAQGMASQSAGAVQISDSTGMLQQAARSAVDGLARLSLTAGNLEKASAALRSEVAAFRIRAVD